MSSIDDVLFGKCDCHKKWYHNCDPLRFISHKNYEDYEGNLLELYADHGSEILDKLIQHKLPCDGECGYLGFKRCTCRDAFNKWWLKVLKKNKKMFKPTDSDDDWDKLIKKRIMLDKELKTRLNDVDRLKKEVSDAKKAIIDMEKNIDKKSLKRKNTLLYEEYVSTLEENEHKKVKP